MIWSDARISVYRLAIWSDCRSAASRCKGMYVNSTENALSISSCCKLLPKRSWSELYERKTLRLLLTWWWWRYKNLHIRWCLVEAETGSQRAVDRRQTLTAFNQYRVHAPLLMDEYVKLQAAEARIATGAFSTLLLAYYRCRSQPVGEKWWYWMKQQFFGNWMSRRDYMRKNWRSETGSSSRFKRGWPR